MKKLILSAIFAAVAFTSNAQIINVQAFEFQQETIVVDYDAETSDTSYSETYLFSASYTFDLTQNTLTTFIDNQTVTGRLIRYADLDDNTMVFVYEDSPTAGWYVNTKTQSISFFEMTKNGEVESRITKSIFIMY
jgi:hypothetical protein